MLDITTNTIVKNGADFIESCLNQVLPFVKKSIVSVSRISTDGTIEILERMAKLNPKIELDYYADDHPNNIRRIFGLTGIRNKQLARTKSEWIWVLDDDEFYPTETIKSIFKEIENNTDNDSFSLKFWFLVDWQHYQPQHNHRKTIRFYENVPDIKWQHIFTQESIEVKNPKFLNHRYFHLSYLKKNSWRNEGHMDRWRYPKYDIAKCVKLSQENLKELHEKAMPNVQGHKI